MFDKKTINVSFKFLREIKQPIQTISKNEKLSLSTGLYSKPLPLIRLNTLIAISLGSILLLFVFYIITIDITVWGKDIGFIFFGSRPYESIDLGIGMKIIHYFNLRLIPRQQLMLCL